MAGNRDRIKEEIIQRYIGKGHSRKGAEILAEMTIRKDPRLKRR